MKFSVRFHDFTKQTLMGLFNDGFFPKTVIEIGVFEGDTTCNMVGILGEKYEDYKHYAIDPFFATENLTSEVVGNAKEFFYNNISGLKQVEVIEKTSFNGLLELHNRGVKADFIYVDGSHFAKDVLIDAALGFELLNVGGIMLFDDAVSWRYGDQIQDSPKIAVDAFVHCNWNRLEVLCVPNGWQVAVKKTK